MNEKKLLQKIYVTTSIGLSSIIAMLVIMRIIRLGKAGIPLSLGFIIASIILDLFIIKYNGANKLKKYIIGTCLLTGLCIIFLTNGFSLQNHYLIICSLAIMVLFLEPKVFLIYCIALSTSVIGLYAVKPTVIYGDKASLSVFFNNYLVLVAICGLLYLLTVWGNNRLIEAIENQKHAELKSDEINNILTEVKSSVLAIDTGVQKTNQNTAEMNELNQEVCHAVNSMKDSIQNRARQLTNLGDEMNVSIEQIDKAQEQSHELTLAAENVDSRIESAMNSVEEINRKMEVLSQSSQRSVTYVEELSSKINSVSKLLDGIQSICNQTTMLALNASIEAARAGEAGSGFAVVASSIGELAQSSSKIVVDINKLNEDMVYNSKMVSEQVEENRIVTQESKDLLQIIEDSFTHVKSACSHSNSMILEEVNIMKSVTESYNVVKSEINDLSDRLTENMKEMNKIHDSMKHQETKIEVITEDMQYLKDEGQSLNKYFN